MLLKPPLPQLSRTHVAISVSVRPRSRVSARHIGVASVAAASTTLTESMRKATLLERRYDGSGSGVFLSRKDCLEILNRITDSCEAASLAASLGASADMHSAKLDAGGAPGLTPMVSRLFDALYDNAEEVFLSKRGYIIPKREAALVEATGGSPTYGEITGPGVMQFLQTVPLQPDDVLVDLGSGLGRLVLQVACSARLRRCVGIELAASRHEQACWVASQVARLDDSPLTEEEGEEDQVMADGTEPRLGTSSDEDDGDLGRRFLLEPRRMSPAPPPPLPPPELLQLSVGNGVSEGSAGQQQLQQLQSRLAAVTAATASEEEEEVGGLLLSPVELRCEDLMEADLGDGSAFFLCSTAFSGAACRAIAERLTRHRSFRLLVTSRALPCPTPLTLLGQFPCEFTWTATGTAYVYGRSLREAPARLLAAFLSSDPAAAAVGVGQEADRHAGDGSGGEDGAAAGAAVGGIAFLPSTSTLSVLPGDLMV